MLHGRAHPFTALDKSERPDTLFELNGALYPSRFTHGPSLPQCLPTSHSVPPRLWAAARSANDRADHWLTVPLDRLVGSTTP